MNKLKCFVLEGKELYLDEVFVDFNDLPIYFSCISNDQYYLALCCNYENQDYVVVESSAKEIVEMLTSKIAMRNTFTKKSKHWIVISGEDISLDKIQRVESSYMDEKILPIDGAKYIVTTEGIRQYLNRLESDLYNSTLYTTIDAIPAPTCERIEEIEQLDFVIPISYTGCFVLKSKSSQFKKTTKSILFAYDQYKERRTCRPIPQTSSNNKSFGMNDSKEKAVA